MQASPLGSVDLLNTGPPANASAAKTGQDGIFAAHLAAASQQKTTAQPQETRGTQKNSPSAHPISGTETGTVKDDSVDDPSLDATLNGSAGAANAAIIPVPVSTDAESTPKQSMMPAQGRDSIVSQMLDSLSLGTGTAKATVQTSIPTTETAGATVPPLQNGADGQTFTLEEGQTALPATTPPRASAQNALPAALPGTSGTNVTSSTNSNGGIISLDNTATLDTAEATGSTGTAGQTAVSAAAVIAQSQPAETPTAGQQGTAQQGADQIVQNKYGQIITIHQSSEAEEMAAATVTTGAAASTGPSHLNLDINNNYIHSHLPNEAPAGTTENESGGQQQDPAQDNQQKEANIAKNIATQTPPEQAASQKFQISVGQENQPLLFAHQQVSASLTASTDSTSSTAASMFRLSSGLVVPEGTVVDQMIAHFSMNRQSETSTVNLKLYPQELGELRMEIKVSQDNIKAHIIAQNPQAEEMINRHLPRLREALEQQGLHLQQVDITVATPDSTGEERFQEHASQQQLNRSFQNRSSQPIFSLNSGEESEEAATNLSVLA